MKKKILVLMLASMLAASCVACGSKSSDKKDELSSAATEILSETETETEQLEEQDITADALTPLADAGVITGVEDIIVPEGTDVNLNELVYADKNIVKSVDIDDSKVDYSKTGTYKVIYTITFDGEKLRDYVKENNINVNFDTNDKTIVVKTTVTVTVATKEDAEKAIANGNTNVVTPETEKSVAENNKAKANDNAVASKPAEKPAKKPADNSNGNSSNAGKNNSGNNSGNSSNSAESKPSGGNNSSTEEPHEHHYNCVSTTPASCTTPGEKVYTCTSCNHSYKETLHTTDHDYVQRTEPVTIKEAWTEDVFEPRYICNGCGATFKTATDAGDHILDNPYGNCNNYRGEDFKVNTINHPAIIETRTYTVCSHCGKRP